jgi:long-chain acyl-CoA synthetase
MIDIDATSVLTAIPPKIGDIVKRWAAKTPDQPALIEGGQTLTYGQLNKTVSEARSWLESCCVRPGDRVMLVSENCRAFAVMLFALAEMDSWPVLVSARLSANEVDQIRNHCGARRVIYTLGASPHVAKHAKRHGAEIQEMWGLGSIGLSELSADAIPEPIDADPGSRVAALIYTSGTTGLPKGVMLTHRNLLFLAAVSARIRCLEPQDRMYGVLPMTHGVGLSVVLLGSLLSGATLYMLPRFDPVAAIATLERDRFTVMLGVPAMFALLVEYAKSQRIESLECPALRIISSSGAPLDAPLKTSVEQLFGMVLHNGYGVTECSPTIAQARLDDPRRDTSVGRVLPGVEIRLVGSDGKPVGEGEVGELHVRGPNVMKGYYRAPEETAAAIDSEGWFNTRDLARLDDSNLFIEGRTKELIVRFGFNVYPAEVEGVLNAHPAVARSAVIGRAIEKNEEVLAFVQLQPNSAITPADLEKHAAQHLASYKQPSRIFIVEELPLTPTGKVMKEQLAKTLA